MLSNGSTNSAQIPQAPLSDVQAQLNRLYAGIDHLQSVSDGLIDGISPVLKPDEPSAAEKGCSGVERAPLTPLAGEINQAARLLESLGARITATTARLGV